MSKSTQKLSADAIRPGVPIYNVSLGDESREIQAANEREAIRRFGSADPLVKAELVKGDERVPGLLPTGEAGAEPPKRRYRVSWGDDVREVIAVHKDDAWSQFVGGQENSLAYKQPTTYERIVEDLGPADDGSKPEEADKSKKKGK